MTQTATKDLTATIAAYFAMWNEGDASARAKLIEQAWTEAGKYSDPGREAHGYEALSAMVEALQPQFPGHSIRQSSGIESHGQYVRFAWEVVAPDGSVPVDGIDFGVLAPDGRLQQITGFFGDLPAA